MKTFSVPLLLRDSTSQFLIFFLKKGVNFQRLWLSVEYYKMSLGHFHHHFILMGNFLSFVILLTWKPIPKIIYFATNICRTRINRTDSIQKMVHLREKEEPVFVYLMLPCDLFKFNMLLIILAASLINFMLILNIYV